VAAGLAAVIRVDAVWHTANLRRNGFDRSPQRRIFTPILLHRAFAHLRCKRLRLVHDTILSRIGASSKPGAIQTDIQIGYELAFKKEVSNCKSGYALTIAGHFFIWGGINRIEA